jgi:hypothetical protein
MTGLKKLGLILITCSIIMAFSNVYRGIQTPLQVKNLPITPVSTPMLIHIDEIDIDQTDSFLDAIAFSESSNRYKVTNRWGYMGKYQFHKQTLKDLGYKVSKKEFLNSPQLQEQAMMDLLSSNKKSLGYRIQKWEGKRIQGTRITESGILAAAHLGGVGNLIRFMENGEDFKDGNGTSIVKYLTKFSGYNIKVE